MPRYRKNVVVLGVLVLATGAGSALVPGAGVAKPKHKVVKVVKVQDDLYSPKKLTIKRGNEINFVWNQGNVDSHNVVFVSGPSGVSKTKFSSATATTGIKFKLTFSKKGTYHFKCTIHPANMRLTVIVKS